MTTAFGAAIAFLTSPIGLVVIAINPNCRINELGIIPKPPYMRWAKYSALMMKYRELQDEYWRAFIRQCPGAIPPNMLAALSGYCEEART